MVSIQRQPEARWEVGSLARQVAMSRTAFASRFKALVGESPFSYVTRCRMNKANGALRSSDATIADVAERAGYDSESSFCRAFKRWLGRSPAAFRGTRGGDTPGAKTSISTVGTSAEHFED
jgi:AraC-like DNA-binding protein